MRQPLRFWLLLSVLVPACFLSTLAQSTETEAETIAKALTALSSDELETRKRAVLILGKYESAAARAGLTRALEDESALIRRSALVALTNQLPNLQQTELILLMTADPDVSIRRIASSNLPRLLSLYRVDPLRSRTVARFPAEVRRALSKAFRDSDATVRKNMIANWTSMLGLVYNDKELVLRGLKDSERDVRAAALQGAAALLGPSDFVSRSQVLLRDPDRKIRLLLAQLLARRGRREALSALQTLSQDKDSEVAIEAQIGRLENGDHDAWPALQKKLAAGRLEPAAAERVIRQIPNLAQGGKELLQEYMQHKRAKYRQAALKTYGQSYWEAGDRGILMVRLQDESKAVREVAGALLARDPELPARQVEKLAASRYPDVRQLSLILTRALPDETALEISLGLLIDEQDDIRATAIALIAVREFDGWQDILVDSLADPAAVVRQQAVLQLLDKRHPEARNILNNYLATGKDAELKEFIRRRMAPRRPQPILPDW